MGFFDKIGNKIADKVINDLKNEGSITTDMTQDTSILIWGDEEENGHITEDKAMSIPALASGVDLIANSIASLPVKLFKINEYGEKEEIKDDMRVRLLNISNNGFDSAYNLKYAQVKSLILHGTSYVYIAKDNRNKIQGLYYLDFNSVQPQSVKFGNGMFGYQYNFSIFNDYFNNVQQDQILLSFRDAKRSEDIVGRGVLDKGAKVLNLALQELDSASTVLGTKIDGYLSIPTALSPQAKSNIRKTWRGFSSSGQVPVLEEGLEFKQLNYNSKEMELLDSRKYSTELIAQLLNLPFTYLLSSASSYNNSQEESLRFMKQALLPYISILQESYNKFMLTEKELMANYRFEFDTSTILKASAQEQMNYLMSAKNGGIMSANECRSELGLQAVDGGDFLEVPVNSYLLQEGEVILPSAEYDLKKEGKVEEKEEVEVEEGKEEDIEASIKRGFGFHNSEGYREFTDEGDIPKEARDKSRERKLEFLKENDKELYDKIIEKEKDRE